MRLFTVLCATLFLSSLALGQMPMVSGCAGYYGCGPYVPLVTTPSISLQTVSPSPVGATNATTGLIAGAANSTLSLVNGNTSSVYTEAVWYSGGGAPVYSSPSVSLEARPASAAAKSGRKATRTITNQDIDQENQKTGMVKYDGKTEEIK